MRPVTTLIVLALVKAAWTAPVPEEIDLYEIRPTSIATCDSLILRQPQSLEAYRCYSLVAIRYGRWAEGIRSLEARLRMAPDDGRALLHLGMIESRRRRTRAEKLLREAGERLGALGEGRGQVQAWLELSSLLDRTGRKSEARSLAENARGQAQGHGVADLEVDAILQLARTRLAERDLVTARSLYEQARELAQAVEPGLVHARLASGVASMAWAEGKLRESLNSYRESAELYSRFSDPFEEARELYNAALVTGRLVHGGGVQKSEVINLATQAVDVAIAAGNPRVEALARMLLAQDPDADLDTRIDETTLALELLRRADSPGRVCFSLRTLAGLLMQRDGEAGLDLALELLAEALDCAASVGSTEDQIRAWIVRAGLFHLGRPKADCVQDLLDAVEGIEALRDRQPDQLVRARFLWDWAFVYYRLAGRLLEPLNEAPVPEAADLAFRTIEKLRARVLLDSLDSARVTESVMKGGVELVARRQDRDEILLRIASVQRDLMAPGLSKDEARVLLDELRGLEAREVELRVSMAQEDTSIAMLRMPQIPSLSDLQQALAPDQALLSFHLSTRETDAVKWYWNGGSWVFVITHDGWFVVPLADRDVIDKRIAVYLGLLTRRDSLEREAGARLHEDLLSGAVAGLGPGIRRWVVVPDGGLHRLPLAALRPTANDEPLAADIEISQVPSATLWYHWKTTSATPRPAAVLALADADLETVTGGDGTAERSVPWLDGHSLEPLPHARTEARGMLRNLGRGGELRTGRGASEHFLKTVELQRFGVIHLATHSVIDPREPQRSAVLLNPGVPEEDGQLQLREVVELELDDTVVILSACSSALGEITDGEGVVGMARAFFQAGARTVVASLWPLRDDEAERLMTSVGEALGRGASVGAAVGSMRRAAISVGRPTTAWAGLVVLGDPDHVPVPAGVGADSGPRSWWLAGIAVFGFLALLTILLRRRLL